MQNRIPGNIFKLTIAAIFSLTVSFSTVSCDKFINLGDSASKGDMDDSLPEDFNESGDKQGSGDNGMEIPTGDESWDTGDTGTTGDTENYDGSPDEEISDDDSFPYPDNDVPIEEYPFPEDFLSEQCDCGENPAYKPVCCKGKFVYNISVFNACFANCYFLYSEGKICSSYNAGICDSIPEPDEESPDKDSDEETLSSDDDSQPDEDEEPSDEDASENDEEHSNDEDFFVPDNECGCYPSDTEILCCYKNSTVIITRCLAECHCKGAYSSCFSSTPL